MEVMTVQPESILIVGANPATSEEFAKALGTNLGTKSLFLKTKYYEASVPVCFSESSPDAPLSENIKAVVILDLPAEVSNPVWREMNEDAIKILYTHSERDIDVCLEHGFELVLDKGSASESEDEHGIPRVLKALECRMWTPLLPDLDPLPSSCPETLLTEFDDLMQRIKCIRESASVRSDEERRSLAALAAMELANLLCDSDSYSSD
jgi:hypothetical protein